MREKDGNKKSKRAPLFAKRYFIYDLIRIFGLIPGLIWFHPVYRYVSKEARKRIRGGALVISNHIGFYDPVYLFFAVWYRRQHFVCKKEFFEGKTANMFRSFCCIPIDTENPGVRSFKEIISTLKQNRVVTIFPEGHISGSDHVMATFKSGVALMALQSGKPIVPIFIKPKKHFYSPLVFVIGEAIDAVSLADGRPGLQTIEQITESLHEREKSLELLADRKNYKQYKKAGKKS